jgi:hypothetical protein
MVKERRESMKYLYESVSNLKRVSTDSTSILVSSRKQAIRRDIEMVSTGSAVGLLL